MPVVRYKGTDGEMKTISGEESITHAMEAVFEDVCGMPLSELKKRVSDVSLLIDGRLHFFVTFVKTAVTKAERAKADGHNVNARLRQRTKKNGFMKCPECGVVHTDYVLWCRNPKCDVDLRHTVPQEDDDEVREYMSRPIPVLDDVEEVEQPEEESDVQKSPSSPMDDMILGQERENVEED